MIFHGCENHQVILYLIKVTILALKLGVFLAPFSPRAAGRWMDPKLRSGIFLMAKYHHSQLFDFHEIFKLGVANSSFFSAAGGFFFEK